MKIFEDLIVNFSNWLWGLPLLILLLGGGVFFLFYSNFIPFKYFSHAVNVLRGKYDDPSDPGQINHYEALSTALAATVGMGNISGVAVAITTGGPGAIFWMWVSAFFGIATKFFTCTLSVMYRGKDTAGEIQGGPMYVIVEGLGKKWKPLALFFSTAGLIGMLPIFQANQFTQIIRDVVLIPNGIAGTDQTNFITGIIITIIVSSVIFGGIKRIGKVAGKMVPLMVVLYFVSVGYIILVNYTSIIPSFEQIFADAFSGNAVLGGALGAIIIAGARRAAFSNEAGIGTAPMAHGAAKTNEPIREGLVAMLGPAIDTLVVCTLTALAILITGTWQNTTDSGVTITVNAFNQAIPGFGMYILVACVTIFAMTSLFSYSYYGTKCFSFIAGAKNKRYFNYFYVATIVFGAVASLKAIISLIDAAYALMSIPTMVSAILLAPKVKRAAKKYFSKLEAEESEIKVSA
ncbi:alanine/glycine:cation symporter family protein [Fulvivirgaceae bacterium BMA10]|uniref:Alanine/glycine:cation symporter family protein n=1 Tax=Splendidivirga corallicola TaxID=3051826 RepID=A0ABT8KH62_9BACT|nr:alanine/glycine:cation symporter family protein [Fulvivirgaceae bacterium BMA10]